MFAKLNEGRNQKDMAPLRWTMAAELLWLQNKVPTYLQIGFPEHLRVWPREPSKNSPDEDTKINESGLDLANDEVNTELDHENSVSDGKKLSQLDAEQTEVLNATIKHRHKKLWEWFQNNTKGKKTTSGGTSSSKILSMLLGQHTRGTQDLKEVKVYLQIHYESKVKPLVSDDIKENNLVLSGSTQANVLQTSQKIKLGSVVAGQDQTKEEIYRAIQELPIMLGQIFEELSTLMGGWHYSLVMGGPDPLCKGDIMMLSYHHGKSLEGLSFKTLTPNFHKQYLLPFEKHLGHIYGPSVKGTSVPASASSSPPPSTINLILPSTPSAPPLSTMDLLTSTPSVPPLLTMDPSASTPSTPPWTIDLILLDEPSDQSSAHLLQGQEFNTSGLVLDPPQWNGWQSHPDPNPSYMFSIAPDSPITAWRRDCGFDRNATMSAALPSTIMQPQLPYSPPLTFVPDFPVSFLNSANVVSTRDLSLHQHSLLVPLPNHALPVSSPERALPVSLPEHALPVSLLERHVGV
ncbi:hypothetical protein BDR03DRAFT_985175 [Suillus americanus]|nr:hypothetical protein BDR03DRAFT_985175 [Suillus americanus]